MKPDDAVIIVQEVFEVKDKSAVFGRLINVEKGTVLSIHEKYSNSEDRLLQVVIQFTRQDQPTPNWKVIIDALRNPLINSLCVADQIETKYSLSKSPFLLCDIFYVLSQFLLKVPLMFQLHIINQHLWRNILSQFLLKVPLMFQLHIINQHLWRKNVSSTITRSTKVLNPRRKYCILRTTPMRVHRNWPRLALL